MKACDNPKCEWHKDVFKGALTGKLYMKGEYTPYTGSPMPAPEKLTVTYKEHKPELGLCPACAHVYCMLIEFHPMNNIMV